MHWFRRLKRLFRKRSADKLIADADLLLRELDGLGKEPQPKLCRECQWYKRSSLDGPGEVWGRCVSPSQPDYNIHAGTERWPMARSTRYACRGEWWLRKVS